MRIYPGNVYEKRVLLKHLEGKQTEPITNDALSVADIVEIKRAPTAPSSFLLLFLLLCFLCGRIFAISFLAIDEMLLLKRGIPLFFSRLRIASYSDWCEYREASPSPECLHPRSLANLPE